MSQRYYLGIDVSKHSLDIAIRPTGQQLTVANNDQGFAELQRQLPSAVEVETSGGRSDGRIRTASGSVTESARLCRGCD